jgi:protein TonB
MTAKLQQDVRRRSFAVLLASKPAREAGGARSTFVSVALHALAGLGMVYATTTVAQEVSNEGPDAIEIELAKEIVIPPPPPPPDAPLPAVRDEVFRGFRTLDIPDVIPPDIPPSIMEKFRELDFTGQGVENGRGDGRLAPPGVVETVAAADPETPSFTPHTVKPRLINLADVERALVREYPPLLRDAGIGGTVTVWLFIDAEGRVANTKIDKESGYAQLDEAAREVASIMRFTPAQNRDLKVPVWVSIPIRFRVG